jgi:uncharacterized protein
VTRARAIVALVFAAAALAAPIAQAAEIPALTGRVIDRAGILSGGRERLDTLLREYESRTTNQVVVLTLPTLGGEPIEDFAKRAFDSWGLGQKEKDNGVLVVVVPNDHKMRIEVGRGLEESLTSAAAQRILDQVMAPALRGGDYAGGFERGVQAVIAQLDGAVAAEEGAPATAATPPQLPESSIPAWVIWLIVVLFLVIVAMFIWAAATNQLHLCGSSRSRSSGSWSGSSSSSSSSGFSGGGGSSGGSGASGSW